MRKWDIFYGWYVLAAASVCLFFIQGARTVLGVMFKPILNEMLWTRSDISLAVLLNMVIFALSLTLVGRLFDRYGAKWVIIVATLFLAVSYAGISFIGQRWQLMVFYGVLAALGFAGTSVPLFAALASRWFHRHKGTAIGLALAGSCLGQYVLVPLSTRLMLAWGWRPAFMSIGAMVLVVNLTLAWKVIKDSPHAIGLQPYGEGRHAPQEVTGRTQAVAAPTIESDFRSDFNLGQAMTTRSFWLFLIIMVICGGGDNFILTHLIPMVTDYGISSTSAGHMLAWSGLLSLAGVLLAGPVADRIGNKIPIAITFLLRAIVFALVLRYQNMVSFYILALVFGFTMLITAPLCVTLLGRLYGFAHIGLLSGFITTLHHLGGGLWVYGGGVIFDQTGSYRLAFVLATLFSLIAVLCAVVIKEKRHTIKRC